MRWILTVAVMLVAMLAAESCFESKSKICASGGACPIGYQCTASGDGCIEADSLCGNGRLDPEEICDDGNADDTDNCISDCTSDGRCGNGLVDSSKGEVCDNGLYNGGDNPDGGEKCSNDCKSRLGCGNGIVDTAEGEECDDGEGGIPIDTKRCTRFCELSSCGDGYVNDAGGEICDDESITWIECPYGMAKCLACSSRACARYDELNGHKCGDSVKDPLPDGGMEACDDGNEMNESTCDIYGIPCDSCNATCTAPISLLGPHCGDGLLNGPLGGLLEICDDGNASTCGTCSTDCSAIQDGGATGTITAVSSDKLNDITDGGMGRTDTFTLNDGADGGNNPQTFEFDPFGNGVHDRSHRRIDPSGCLSNCNDESVVADKIASAINLLTTAIDFKIKAVPDGGRVLLFNTVPGVIGNQKINKNVQNNGFEVSGMDGGSGGDCPPGAGCMTDGDCYPPLTCQGLVAGLKRCQ